MNIHSYKYHSITPPALRYASATFWLICAKSMLMKRARQDCEQTTRKKAKEERGSNKMVYITEEQKKGQFAR